MACSIGSVCHYSENKMRLSIEPLFESIIDVVETGNNTGRLEDGMIIMKLLLPILLILEQGIFPVGRGVRA